MKRPYVTAIIVCTLALHYPGNTLYATDLTLLNTILPGQNKISPQSSDTLYTSLLEQLLEIQSQPPVPQSDIQTAVEPWILELFSAPWQQQPSLSPETLNQAKNKKQTVLSLLTLSLEEYRKKSKSTR